MIEKTFLFTLRALGKIAFAIFLIGFAIGFYLGSS